MKRSCLIVVCLLLCVINSYSQKDSTTVNIDDKTLKVVNGNDSTRVYVNNARIKNVGHGKDTTSFRIGNKLVLITNSQDGTAIKIKKFNKNDTTANVFKNDSPEDEDSSEDICENKTDHTANYRRFKGHYAGIELGLNNYVTSGVSLLSSSPANFMSVKTSRSLDFNINIFQHSFGLISDKFGAVTGLGFEFCNYYFENNNTLGIDSATGNTVGLNYPAHDAIQITKLATIFLTVPLILEFKTNAGIHLSAGIVGSLKLGDHTKVVYNDQGASKTDKNYDDFNLNPFRYGATFRIGYNEWEIFANYTFTPLFESGKGPVLYPIAVGLALEFE